MDRATQGVRCQPLKRFSTSLSSSAGMAMLVAFACSPASRPQSHEDIQIPHPTPPPGLGGPSIDDPTMATRQHRALNADRQKEIVSDTNKLLKLARELNYDVAASGLQTLAPDDLRKLGEIERLAHSVKERMAIEAGPVP